MPESYPLQTGKPGIWEENIIILFPKMLLDALRDSASGWASSGQDRALVPVSPYLSLVAIEAGTAAGVGVGIDGSSSEAGMSLTLSWGAGAENRPDTLKLISADRAGAGLNFQSFHRPLHPGRHQDHFPFLLMLSRLCFTFLRPGGPHSNPTKHAQASPFYR